MDDRTTALEEHIAHHAAALDDISRQMADQWATIRRMEKAIERLAGHVKSIDDAGGEAPEITPPPHY